MPSTEAPPRPPRFEVGDASLAAEKLVTVGWMARARRAVLVVITLINFLGPFAAGAWLALRGLRVEAGVGLALAVLMPMVFALVAFRPATALTEPLLRRGRRPHPAAVTVVGFLATGWQYCVIAAWTLGVFWFFGRRMAGDLTLPVMVWAYGTVMCSLSFMASNDHSGDSAPAVTLAFAFAACAINALLRLNHVQLLPSGLWLVGLVIVATLINTALVGVSAVRLARARCDDEAGEVGRDLHGILRARPEGG